MEREIDQPDSRHPAVRSWEERMGYILQDFSQQDFAVLKWWKDSARDSKSTEEGRRSLGIKERNISAT